jgi:hypothetical protein
MQERHVQSQQHVQLRRAASLLLLAGCTETGVLLNVHGDGNGAQSTVATLELFAATKTFCDRWVHDGSASLTHYPVAGRDLDKKPYQILVRPTHVINLDDSVEYLIAAFDASGALVGSADFGDFPFRKNRVEQYDASIDLLKRPQPASGPGPSYFAGGDEDCVCMPGRRWLGNGRATQCDLRVVPSQDRVSDTAGCDIPPGRQLSAPVCDGQTWNTPGDTPMRDSACFVADAQGCHMVPRRCADQDGVAWDGECDPADPMGKLLPSSALCDAFAQCEQTPCNDLDGCFFTSAPQSALSCTLTIDPATSMPCPTKSWQFPLAQLNTPQCIAEIVYVTPPLEATVMNTVTAGCVPTLTITSVGTSLDAVPSTVEIDVVLGDKLMRLKIAVVKSCVVDGPGLSCHA